MGGGGVVFSGRAVWALPSGVREGFFGPLSIPFSDLSFSY